MPATTWTTALVICAAIFGTKPSTPPATYMTSIHVEACTLLVLRFLSLLNKGSGREEYLVNSIEIFKKL